jgi:hypothetical protein
LDDRISRRIEEKAKEFVSATAELRRTDKEAWR